MKRNLKPFADYQFLAANRLAITRLAGFLLSAPALMVSNPLALKAESPAIIAAGTSQQEVLLLLGSPKTKEELESKRISIWRYGTDPLGRTRTVSFQEGKVTNDSLQSESDGRGAHLQSRATSPKTALPRTAEAQVQESRGGALSFTGKEVFQEISKLEESPDGSSPAPAGNPRSPFPMNGKGR